MELETQQSQATDSPENTEVVEELSTPQTDEGEVKLDGGGNEEAVPPVEAPPTYTPNLKYSVGNEEKEFPELFKEFLTNEEREKALRDLYTKADGLDHIKTKRDEYATELQTIKSQVGEVVKAAEVGDYRSVMDALGVDTSDVGKVMHGLGITKEQILQHAYQLAQLTPEQEHAQNQVQQLEREKAELFKQKQEYADNLYRQQVQAREAELQNVLSSQEISGLATQFDKAFGKPGSFRSEVIRRAQHAAHFEGKDLTPMQAVEQVLQMAKMIAPQAATSTAKPKMEVPPVIPSVPTGGAAPVKRKVNSLEQLEAYASTLPND